MGRSFSIDLRDIADFATVRDLNGHEAFESMSLLGGLIFLLKQHIS